MTEQPTPSGPAASRPVPDLGFFAPVGPARSPLPAPPGQVAVPENRFAPPPGHFAPPPGQFGNAPVTPFGATPPGYSPFPVVQQPGGMPGWAIALIAVAGGLVFVMVLAAVAIPVFLNQRAKATAAATTVTLPETLEGLQRLRTPEAEAAVRAQLDSMPTELLKDAQGAAYTDGDQRTIFVQIARFRRVAEPGDVDDVINGFHHGVTSDLPAGVTTSEWRDRASGLLGGRISCATLQGDSTGQICAAVESTTLLAMVEIAPNAAPDPGRPLRVREAVIHRQR